MSRLTLWIRRNPDYAAAGFFVALQALVTLALMRDLSTWYLMLWYCNNVSLFIAIAFFTHNLQLAKGLAYVGLLPQLLWVSDFVGHYLGFDLSNTSNYILVEGFTFPNEVSVLSHMTMPFLALAYTLRERPRPVSLLYAAIYIMALYIATMIFTQPVDDVNCVFGACSGETGLLHLALWPLYVLMLSSAAMVVHDGLYRAYMSVKAKSHRVRILRLQDTIGRVQ
jgi:hypothetical protein